MTDPEKLQRDIDTLRESIRLNWIDLSASQDPRKQAAIRTAIAALVEDLKDLLVQLDTLPKPKS